jgi:hypothetical protein
MLGKQKMNHSQKTAQKHADHFQALLPNIESKFKLTPREKIKEQTKENLEKWHSEFSDFHMKLAKISFYLSPSYVKHKNENGEFIHITYNNNELPIIEVYNAAQILVDFIYKIYLYPISCELNIKNEIEATKRHRKSLTLTILFSSLTFILGLIASYLTPKYINVKDFKEITSNQDIIITLVKENYDKNTNSINISPNDSTIFEYYNLDLDTTYSKLDTSNVLITFEKSK